VILYQMLTGEKPYVGATTEAILEQHRNAAVPVLPAGLEACQPLLNKLLAKDAAQRLGSAREALEALAATLAAVAESAPAEPVPAAG
jgi:serine/threonine protein kinase